MKRRVQKVISATAAFMDREGIHFDAGTTKPADGSSGYATGCLFIDTDGGDGATLLINVGDVDSCNFDIIADS